MAENSPPLLVLCRDLMFVSKITSAAQAMGVEVKIIRDVAALAQIPDASRLIVDLNQPGFLDTAIDWKHRTAGHVTGFVSHVDEQTIAAANEAGLDVVLPRSRFTTQLPQILSSGLVA
jgi:hypothetical protein